jgi:hypothetical protein
MMVRCAHPTCDSSFDPGDGNRVFCSYACRMANHEYFGVELDTYPDELDNDDGYAPFHPIDYGMRCWAGQPSPSREGPE